jgi:hypothetical protein
MGRVFLLSHSVINDIMFRAMMLQTGLKYYKDDMTYKEYILDNATYFVLQNMALKYGAAQTQCDAER